MERIIGINPVTEALLNKEKNIVLSPSEFSILSQKNMFEIIILVLLI